MDYDGKGGGLRQGGRAAGRRRDATWERRDGLVGAPSWVRQQVETWSGWCWVQERMIGNLGHRENDRGQGSIA